MRIALILAGLLVGCDPAININNIIGPDVGAGDSAAVVERIEIVPSYVETVNGERFTLTAQAFAAGGLPISGVAFLWSSSDPAVANVLGTSGATATVKAEGPGEAEVFARSGRAEGKVKVKVRPASP